MPNPKFSRSSRDIAPRSMPLRRYSGGAGENNRMNFLRVEWTKKRGAIALLATGLVVTSFIFGGYVATGNWNPWGNKHYYQVLNANFSECHVVGGVETCSSAHNVLFNAGALWVQQVTSGEAPTGCAPSTTCGFKYIAMSAGSTAPVATDAVTGLTNGDCGKPSADTELTTNGFARALGTVTDITGSSPQSSTVVRTFTATATQAVAKSCLVNQSTAANANNVQLAAATFTSITLNNLDTIQITWTITWTWS